MGHINKKNLFFVEEKCQLVERERRKKKKKGKEIREKEKWRELGCCTWRGEESIWAQAIEISPLLDIK